MSKIIREYTEEQIVAYVELAEEVGIGRAIRELGYPSWPTGQKWCKARGVKPNVDTMMQSVKEFHTFYETTDALIIAEQGFERVLQSIKEDDLDADQLKKISEAYQKFANTWLILQGKASSITKSQAEDAVSVELNDLLNSERAKQSSHDLEPRSTTE